MNKARLVIASILKPVDDPRMYEKFAGSLRELHGLDLHIIGLKTNKKLEDPHTSFHPLFSFGRKHPGRLTAGLRYFKKLIKVKPQVIIVNTPELLIFTILYKILFGTKIFYDVRENYFRNILYNPTYPLPVRPLLAVLVRGTEWLSRPFLQHIILAEQCYARELPFLFGNCTVLENKFVAPNERYAPKATPVRYREKEHFNLLYSGTIARNYGIWEAIALADRLHELHSGVTLTIAGFSPGISVYNELVKHLESRPYIHLEGGNEPLPHKRILELIPQADFGLLPYLPNKSTRNCLPTKLFEYMASGLPMIVQHNPLWEDYTNPSQAALFISFSSPDAGLLLRQMQDTEFYPYGIPTEVFWNNSCHYTLQKLIQPYLTTH